MATNPADTAPSADWAAQAANSIDRLVDTARNKITNPALKLGRAVVYGLVIVLIALICAPLVAVASVRLLTVATGKVWIADFIIGGLFVAIGSFLWSKRSATVKP